MTSPHRRGGTSAAKTKFERRFRLRILRVSRSSCESPTHMLSKATATGILVVITVHPTVQLPLVDHIHIRIAISFKVLKVTEISQSSIRCGLVTTSLYHWRAFKYCNLKVIWLIQITPHAFWFAKCNSNIAEVHGLSASRWQVSFELLMQASLPLKRNTDKASISASCFCASKDMTFHSVPLGLSLVFHLCNSLIITLSMLAFDCQ